MNSRRALPGIVLINTKYPHNLGGIIRACSCFGVPSLVWTGDRIQFEEGERLPREERMRGYRDVHWENHNRPLDIFPEDCIPVCVELVPGSMPLTYFEHPERAVYIFGPEDGHVPQVYRRLCHSVVYIPAYHCLNLAAAVNVVLAHRMVYRQLSGVEPVLPVGEQLNEHRGAAKAVKSAMETLAWDGY